LTNVNPWIEKEILLADMRVIQWKSVKGFEIEEIKRMQKYIQGVDRTPGERPEDKEKKDEKDNKEEKKTAQ
jgi:hypothetical protein